jgi:hypothetical protein
MILETHPQFAAALAASSVRAPSDEELRTEALQLSNEGRIAALEVIIEQRIARGGMMCASESTVFSALLSKATDAGRKWVQWESQRTRFDKPLLLANGEDLFSQPGRLRALDQDRNGADPIWWTG